MKRRHLLLFGLGSAVFWPAHGATWETRKFRSSAAQAWAKGLVRSHGRDYLADTLNAGLTAPTVGMAQAHAVLAAAEVVAAARGQGNEVLPDEVAQWLASQRRSDIARLTQTAVRAVNRILYGPHSEMLDHWKADPGSYEAWRSDLHDLTQRLRRPNR
jgi:hypothetical protein